MTFPDDELEYVTELFLGGQWVDISSDTYQRDPVTITRGRSDESGTVEPSRCSLTINNRSGDYSPRNPTGAHFGVLGRNTPLRVRVDGYLLLDGSTDSFASTPDDASLDITGDLDLRVRVAMDDWTPAATSSLVSKFTSAGGDQSYALQVHTSGLLQLSWSEDGSATKSAASTIAPSVSDGEVLWVRVTIDVDDGASGREVLFYTSSDGETWDQLGDPRTGGDTSIFASTAEVNVGAINEGGSQRLEGKVYEAQILDGIDGTVVANPDFTAEATGTTSFTDDAGLTWTVESGAELTGPATPRFVGEVPSWPVRWDTSGSDVYVPIEAAGVLRRLGQGASPLQSAMRRGLLDVASMQAYWPCEDGENATKLASALPGHPAIRINGTTNVADFDGFVASAPIPTSTGGVWSGTVPTYTATGDIQMRFLYPINDDPGAGGIRLTTAGSAASWHVFNDATGLRLIVEDADGFDIEDKTGTVAADGDLLWISLEMSQDGSDIDWHLDTLKVGATAAVTDLSGTITGETLDRATAVHVNEFANPPGVADTTVGHISVQSTITNLDDDVDLLNAWTGETAGRRIERLCDEEGITFTSEGDLDDTAAVGFQLRKTLLELAREAADSDLGILYEPRGTFGLAYRTRASLYAQAAALELDYAAVDLSHIEPVEDDQATRNDVTVTRQGGASARAKLTEGALSTQAPPDGVGRYDESVTLSLEEDTQTPDQASWRLHLGTVDEARYPVLGVNLGRSNFADADLAAAAKALDLGDKITVDNPPAWLPPDDINQLAQGFTETLTPFEWRIDVNCSPASPWDVAVWDDEDGPGEARYESDGSTLDEDLDTTETGVDVDVATGPLWSDDDQPFDVMIGGERMTVTAVSGSTSPQTFTVTRSVNGVVKAHSSGAGVRLFKRAVLAL